MENLTGTTENSGSIVLLDINGIERNINDLSGDIIIENGIIISEH